MACLFLPFGNAHFHRMHIAASPVKFREKPAFLYVCLSACCFDLLPNLIRKLKPVLHKPTFGLDRVVRWESSWWGASSRYQLNVKFQPLCWNTTFAKQFALGFRFFPGFLGNCTFMSVLASAVSSFATALLECSGHHPKVVAVPWTLCGKQEPAFCSCFSLDLESTASYGFVWE